MQTKIFYNIILINMIDFILSIIKSFIENIIIDFIFSKQWFITLLIIWTCIFTYAYYFNKLT